MRSLIDGWAAWAVTRALERLVHGQLRLDGPGMTRTFGREAGPRASMQVHDARVFRRALTGGEVGLGEAYMDGDWSTPDLVALVRLVLANRQVLAALPSAPAWAGRWWNTVGHRWRDNTRNGSRRNIHAHYDLGNRFFRLFLDANLLYSCGYFEHPSDSLEIAQINKLQRICDKLQLSPRDHVLEIGSGWGGFALYAATRYGCRVTTTTISAEQHAHVADLLASNPAAAGRITLLQQDYRTLRGRFDKIVSIEMFEAVGLRHYDEFFARCQALLAPDGLMLLQAITVDDWRFDDYLRTPSWIAKYIFPGAELASLARIMESLARVTRMSPFHVEQIGSHYARTLHQWRRRFMDRLPEVRAQGFDERFIRMWDLYLAFCEAAFLERHIGDVQILFSMAGNTRTLYGEPWLEGRVPAAALVP
jgi:cyclopropane-fatty-acyl-phospholipid synthase